MRWRAPAGGRLLALTDQRSIELGAHLGDVVQAVDAAGPDQPPAGRGCGVTALTAVAWTPAGDPLTASACGKPGTAGIFAYSAGAWHSAGPGAPRRPPARRGRCHRPGYHGQPYNRHPRRAFGHWHLPRRRLVGRRGRPLAAIARAASWQGRRAIGVDLGRWLGGHCPAGHSFRRRPDGRRYRLAGPRWRTLPQLPAGTATLATGSTGQLQALEVSQGTLTALQIAPGSGKWTLAQTMQVQIPYGSSG